jgi:transcriptional regulator with XRE-family HTH domain
MALKRQNVRGSPNPFGGTEILRDRGGTAVERRGEREVRRLALTLGTAVRDERSRRRMTLARLAELSGLGLTTIHDVEAGRVGSLETYARLADALRLRAEFGLVDPRRREPASRRAADPLHAAMGEAEAAHLRGLGFEVGLDEPFQHYQFAGRADVVAWSTERRALLHIENKTRFPDLQDCFGSFNAKRRFLGRELAARCGVDEWRSETHVLAAIWSGETLRAIRAHAASFAGVCPDRGGAFEAWWGGDEPPHGGHSILILLDPADGARRDRRRWLEMDGIARARPRYRGYGDAVELLRLGSD